MPLSRRYSPEKSAGEVSVFGYDFSPIIPPGVGIVSGTIDFFVNSNPPVPADADWIAGPVNVQDRTLYATLSGGIGGTEYILRWAATTTDGNVWPRHALVLVAPTS